MGIFDCFALIFLCVFVIIGGSWTRLLVCSLFGAEICIRANWQGGCRSECVYV